MMIEVFLQGILEAFPISSSIHLNLFDINNVEFMHLGTGIAFFLFAIEYISPYIKHPLKLKSIKFALKILILILPTAIIGFYLKKQTKILDPYFINLIFAILMLYSNQFDKQRKFKSLTLKQLFIISLIMTLSLLPGASRLGIAFTAFRLFSLSIEEAFINAIIVGIPVTIGAAVLNFDPKIIDITIMLASLMAGILTYFTLKITKKFLKYWNFYTLYRIGFSLIQLYFCIK